MKTRRSRLPVLVAVAAVLLCFAGYGIYRAVHVPKVHVSHVARNWLDSTSGHHVVHHARRRHGHRLARHHRHHHHRYLAHHHRRHHARLARHHRKHHRYQTASYAE